MDTALALRRTVEQVRREVRDRRCRQLRDQVTAALTQAPPVQAAVYLFGSWATNRFDGQSDIDLLVLAPDAARAQQAERRLLAFADDVVALAQDEWQRRLEAGGRFYQRVTADRELLVDTCTGAA